MGKVTDIPFPEAVALYRGGMSHSQLARRYGVSTSTVQKAFREVGQPARSLSESRRKLPLDQAAFDSDRLTPEAMFVLGVLMRRGRVGKGNGVSLRVKPAERHLAEAFRDFLSSGAAIRCRPPRTSRLGPGAGRVRVTGGESLKVVVYSRGLKARLLELGLGSDAVAPELAASAHFWRGFVLVCGELGFAKRDGRPVPFFRIRGRPSVLGQYREFLRSRGVRTRSRVRPKKNNKWHQFSVEAHVAVGAARVLFGDGLDRLGAKREGAEAVLAWEGPRPPRWLEEVGGGRGR